ncbi:hypothetical protein J2W25_006791 [Variovorax boronicumulans]|uniref:Uncharacterized protein n=1 Tax=Variovorax boronicumulans TaxID=436515 RepID=A0AAW8E9A2_9BURK|nr:IS66 family insertion sequence element accessory protein TnpB [Variovorax boronicumulans]MDP9882415.1 hypothetical protein [Variovorax boronicumulans]MDP9927737.1 hypothetical protein [Variovorax boronicumulans]
MRFGAERLLAHVVHALGSANAHHGYMFANARAARIKGLVHDGSGITTQSCLPSSQTDRTGAGYVGSQIAPTAITIKVGCFPVRA